MRTEIFGRSKDRAEEYGLRGCGYLGKIVSYPGGRYEEAGRVYLDLADPHCMLVLGKRGTGKSYTLGVLLEGFSGLEEEARQGLAVLVVDTMSVFHSLKTPNNSRGEVARMGDFHSLDPRSLDNIRIAMPRLSEKRLAEKGVEAHRDISLAIRPEDVSPHLWLRLFKLEASSALGSLLLSCLRSMSRGWGLEDLKEALRQSDASDDEKRGLLALIGMAEGTMLFEPDTDDLVEAGKITVLDISYLGRIGGLDLRAFVVAHLSETILQERTLHTTTEMQAQAGLLTHGTKERPGEDIAQEREGKDADETGGLGTEKAAHEIEGVRGEKEPLVWLVIDEAHLFLPAGVESIATQPLIDWIKLGRHPGLSIVLATQEPSALHDTAIRQADLVISHQITAEPDVQALGKARQSFMTKDRDLAAMVSQMDSRRGLAILFDDKTRKMEYCMVRPRMTLHTGMDASLLG